MAKASFLDLRQRAVAYINAGHTCLEAAEQFLVSHSTVIRWPARAEGSRAAKPTMVGKRRNALAGQREWLLEQVKITRPDIARPATPVERQTCCARPVNVHSMPFASG